MTNDMRIQDRVRAAAPTPTRRVDVAHIADRARRRRHLDRVLVGGAVACGIAAGVFALVSLAAPAPTGGPIIGQGPSDGRATPTGPPPGLAILEPLPAGWQQIDVGDAMFGVPPDVLVQPIGAGEPAPCPNQDVGGAVVYVHRGQITPADGCDAVGPAHAALTVGPVSSSAPDGPLEEVIVNGYVGGRYAAPEPTDPVVIKFWTLDLELVFEFSDLRPGFVDEVLPTITDANGFIRTDDAVGGPPSVAPADPLPPGWQLIEVGRAELGVPADLTIVPIAADRLVCPSDDLAAGRDLVYVREQALQQPGDDEPARGCPQPAVSFAVVVVEPVSALFDPVDDEPVTINGFVGTRAEQGDVVYQFPELDLQLSFVNRERRPALEDAVLATLRNTDGMIALDDGPAGIPPKCAPPQLGAEVEQVASSPGSWRYRVTVLDGFRLDRLEVFLQTDDFTVVWSRLAATDLGPGVHEVEVPFEHRADDGTLLEAGRSYDHRAATDVEATVQSADPDRCPAFGSGSGETYLNTFGFQS